VFGLRQDIVELVVYLGVVRREGWGVSTGRTVDSHHVGTAQVLEKDVEVWDNRYVFLKLDGEAFEVDVAEGEVKSVEDICSYGIHKFRG
jgi:hypothetical protein